MLPEKRSKRQEGRSMKHETGSRRYKRRKKNKCITRKIILASASPRRIKLLRQIGLKFTAVKPYLDESSVIRKFKKSGTKNLVKLLSLGKALWICYAGICRDKYLLQGNEIIVGFDTLIECRKKLIGKPKNAKDAQKIILSLSNKEHKVYTGIGLIDLKKKIIISDLEVTRVYFRKISKQEAKAYIKTKEPMDKAGAYAIQGKGKKFIKRISGDYFNVVGLPLKKFLSMVSF